MNTDTYSLDSFRPPNALKMPALLALLALLAIAPLVAGAEPPSVSTQDTRSVRVSLADLDLSTPEGARAARDRLHETARRLCSELADSQDLSHQANFVACVEQALADALRQTRGPALVSTPGRRETSR